MTEELRDEPCETHNHARNLQKVVCREDSFKVAAQHFVVEECADERERGPEKIRPPRSQIRHGLKRVIKEFNERRQPGEHLNERPFVSCPSFLLTNNKGQPTND
jgi:hypothetical protein